MKMAATFIKRSLFLPYMADTIAYMRDFQKRRGGAQKLLRVALGCIGILALIFLAVLSVRAAWGMYGKFAHANDVRAGAERELETLQGQYVRVEAAVGRLSSERGIEAEVRQRYGVAKPGEGEITIVREEPDAEVFASQPTTLWGRIWDALFVW
jgi:cell division protein FtsB